MAPSRPAGFRQTPTRHRSGMAICRCDGTSVAELPASGAEKLLEHGPGARGESARPEVL